MAVSGRSGPVSLVVGSRVGNLRRPMGANWKVRDGIQTRVGARVTSHRARVKVLGQMVSGPWRRDRQQAIEDRDRLRHERHAEDIRPGETITLERGMELVLSDLERRRMRPATIGDRRERFGMLARLIDIQTRLDEIGPRDVEHYVALRLRGIKEDELRPVTLATATADIRALNTVFTLAIREGYVRDNPIKRARLAKPEQCKEPDWFTPAELSELLESMRSWPGSARLDPARDAEMVELLALTGWRLSEATEVQMDDVSIPKRTAVLNEGKRGRRIHRLNSEALEIVARWKAHRPTGPLFPVKRHSLESALRRWQERLGEPRLHAHALRHSHGSALAAAGVNAHALARSMGHSTLGMALRYVHLAREEEGAVDGLSFRRKGDEGSSGEPES